MPYRGPGKPQLGSVLARPCWYCAHEHLRVVPPVYGEVTTALCTRCGLIQRRTFSAAAEQAPAPTNFYSQDDARARQWLQRRTLWDTDRLSHYVDLVLSHVDPSRMRSALDVGGAEGLFSHLLKQRAPHIQATVLDPDGSCIRYGKERYPELHHIHGLIEHFDGEEGLDLITDFGAIYRSVFPMRTLARYASYLHQDGCLVVALSCSTKSLGDARDAAPPDSLAGLWPAKGSHGIIRMIADPELFHHMLGQHFEQVELTWMRQRPYRKVSPYFIARHPRRIPREQHVFDSEQVGASQSFLAEYAEHQSLASARKLVEQRGLERVALMGLTPEVDILQRLLEELGVKVAYRIHPFAHRAPTHDHLPPVRFLSAVIDDPVDLVILADYAAQEVMANVIQHLGIQDEADFVLGFEKRAGDPPLFVHVGDTRWLYKAFRFRPLGS